MLFASFFGDAVFGMFLLAALLGFLYKRCFPQGEPAEMAKSSFLKLLGRWLK